MLKKFDALYEEIMGMMDVGAIQMPQMEVPGSVAPTVEKEEENEKEETTETKEVAEDGTEEHEEAESKEEEKAEHESGEEKEDEKKPVTESRYDKMIRLINKGR